MKLLGTVVVVAFFFFCSCRKIYYCNCEVVYYRSNMGIIEPRDTVYSHTNVGKLTNRRAIEAKESCEADNDNQLHEPGSFYITQSCKLITN